MLQLSPFFEKNTVYGEKSFAYIMEAVRSIDIDTDSDFAIAEAVMQHFY